MRRKRSLVTQREGSSNWYCNFSVKGHRFRDSLGTDNKETAEILAAKIQSDALLGDLTGKKPEMSLTAALARDWLERGQRLKSAASIRGWALALQNDKIGLGKNTLLSEITPASLVTYRTHRLVKRVNATINNELRYLRTLLIRARDVWKVHTPEIKWKHLLLEENEHERELSLEEQERLFRELRADYHGMVWFALVTGVRLNNVISLTWKQVDWEAGRITFRTKSKKRDGEIQHVPITKKVAAILLEERERHPIFVFTYVCKKNKVDSQGGGRRDKHKRYPFTNDGWRYSWRRALKRAGLWENRNSPDRFRFHDLRHTAATRVLRKTGNLKTVQRMLGHKNISTTSRYAHVSVEDVRDAMEEVDKAQS